MNSGPEALFRSLDAHGLRRPAAFYLLAFLLAVAFAPHRHANSIEDLLSDGPSDSGIFVEQPSAPGSGSCVNAARIVDDDPCLACFHNDSITEATTISLFSPGSEAVQLAIPSRFPRASAASVARTRSRAPPPLA